jgi:hypothetical protein
MRRYQDGLLDAAEDLSDTANSGPIARWVMGVGLAAALGLYAVRCIVTGHAIFPRLRGWEFVEYDGLCATGVGVAYLFTAAFMHLHWYWTASPRFWGYAQLGKMIAAAGILGGLGLLAYGAFAH